ncbi:MAG TPA: condensation domain-containing protein, partial [Candidatus Caenarcaniphilales bacterium]
MVTIVEFLAYLRSLDIQVFVQGDRLRCNAPAGVLTPELRAQLAARKAELISLLHQASLTSMPLQPTAWEKFPSLSFAQQRLWLLNQLAPENPFYNVPAAVRLSGQLNLLALEQAFNAIVSRHEALRTTFITLEGQPAQVIAPQLNLSVAVTDLQATPVTQREAIAQRLATEEAQRPFNLTTGPLLRVKLLQLNETESVLLLTLHHIVSDGWSL